MMTLKTNAGLSHRLFELRHNPVEFTKMKRSGSRCPLCIHGRMNQAHDEVYICNACGCRFNSEVLAVNAAATLN
jgi:ribosomal protein L37AE/L43A